MALVEVLQGFHEANTNAVWSVFNPKPGRPGAKNPTLPRHGAAADRPRSRPRPRHFHKKTTLINLDLV